MGVLFGAHLTDRSQRGLQRSGQRYEYLRWRETVFADFLVAYNQMRRLLVSTSVQVRLSQPPAEDAFGTPLIDGAGAQWEALERANSRIQMLAGGTEVDAAVWPLCGMSFRWRVCVSPLARVSYPRMRSTSRLM